MKKNFVLLGILALLCLAACNDDPENENKAPVCRIITPAENAEFSFEDEINVSVTATDEDGEITQVQLYMDDAILSNMVEHPYDFVIPAATLTPGAHSIKAIAIDNDGGKAEDVVVITITGVEYESADFVTFDDVPAALPRGWYTEGWAVDETTGYDDSYSLKSTTNNSWTSTTKTTTENINAVEFYLKGTGSLYFYIDDTEIYIQLNNALWERHVYHIPEGTHSFKWLLISGNASLDAVHFKTVLAIGMPYQGGIIAYLDETGEHGFIAAKEDQNPGIEWDADNSRQTGATEKGVGGGKINTERIVEALGAGSYAAQICNDLVIGDYDDWYLPTYDELLIMYDYKNLIGGFKEVEYWTSFESGDNDSYFSSCMKFDEFGAMTLKVGRWHKYRVRAIRYF